MTCVVYHPGNAGDAQRFSKLVEEQTASTAGGVGDTAISFEFADDKCLVTYSKIRWVSADKAREFLGGVE